MTVGSSFIDPLLVPLILGGLLLLLDGGPGTARRAVAAGALFGAAAALKYSGAIFGVAALPLALALPGVSGASRLRVGLAYVAGGVVAFGALAGPWLVLMVREFGNPVFPLLNGWFRSPDAPAANILSERFALGDWGAALSFPFRMALLDRSLYLEVFAPDIRFAALTLVAVALLAAAALHRAAAARALRGADWRCLAFFGAATALWLATSANARYGMALLLLVGVCLVRMVERLLSLGAARITIAIALAVQAATSILVAPARWYVPDIWSKHWLPYVAPERALREPALYLTVETLTMSVVAPFVHPGASFVNFRGQFSIPPDSRRLAALIERHHGHVRALGRDLELIDGKPRAEVVKSYDDTLLRIGYRVDTGDCFTIAWRPDSEDAVSRAANWVSGTSPTTEALSVVSCALVPGTRDPEQVARERYFSEIFDRMEKACPRIFRGQTALTEPLGGGWSRHYVGLDARVEAIGDRIELNRYRAGAHLDLGRPSDWEKGVVPPICGESRNPG